MQTPLVSHPPSLFLLPTILVHMPLEAWLAHKHVWQTRSRVTVLNTDQLERMSQGVSLQNRAMCRDRIWCGWQIFAWPANILPIREPGMFEIGSSASGGRGLWESRYWLENLSPYSEGKRVLRSWSEALCRWAKCNGSTSEASFLLAPIQSQQRLVHKRVRDPHRSPPILKVSGHLGFKFPSTQKKAHTHNVMDQWAQMQDLRTCFRTWHVAYWIVGRTFLGATSWRCSVKVS